MDKNWVITNGVYILPGVGDSQDNTYRPSIMWLTVGLIKALVVLVSAKHDDQHFHIEKDLDCYSFKCRHDELCRVTNVGGYIDGQCMSTHHLPHDLIFGCPQTLLDANECFCNTHDCIQQMQTHITPQGQFAKVGQHSLVQCGDKICKHGDEICKHDVDKEGRLHSHCMPEHDAARCVIEENWEKHLHLRCEDHKDHHTPHCLPNLLSIGKRCFCDTRACVDHTLISLVSAPTTVQPTTVQPTTAMQTNPTTTATITNSPTPAAQTNPPTTAMPSNASTTSMLTNATTTLMLNSTATVPSTTQSCSDDEDANFSCVIYEMMYSLCTAATGTLHAIAHKRCRAYCNICAGSSTSGTASASLPTQLTCIDHDIRCVQYQANICSSSVSQPFVISTCAKTCNKCAEYFAPTTTAQPAAQPVTTAAAPQTGSVTCNTCGDIDQLIPCYSRDVYGNSSTSVCPSGYDYCMTDVYQDTNGNTDVFKRCVTKQVCDSKWTNDSANYNYCTQYGVVNNPNAHECHFCCTGDLCNTNMKPLSSSLVK
ncbi:unnamed protein product [Mytilus coruscus]|uniref:G-protein coupled receptors family 2 profile 1 domain-containing protein n=1 Tax=Mytilus coruscus TaxID=42192 RepID=A0A6J8AX98_MYTCO|nr:unnamed protein product [Mytilus coruscus]